MVNHSRNVVILLFDDAEVLDFCGPFEVFSVTGELSDDSVFRVHTVAEKSPITARNGLSVNPDHSSLADVPKPDILLVPGGVGAGKQLPNEPLIEWIQQTASEAEMVLSVCTGSLLLGKAGLLDGLGATTHHSAFDRLRDVAPACTVHEDRRFVDNGKIVTSAGIAAGIDMSLHVVAKLLGEDVAASTAAYMEYPFPPRE